MQKKKRESKTKFAIYTIEIAKSIQPVIRKFIETFENVIGFGRVQIKLQPVAVINVLNIILICMLGI